MPSLCSAGSTLFRGLPTEPSPYHLRLSDFIFTFHFNALEKEMATHSSVLAWRIPGTGEPGGPRRRLKGSPLFRPEGRSGAAGKPRAEASCGRVGEELFRSSTLPKRAREMAGLLRPVPVTPPGCTSACPAWILGSLSPPTFLDWHPPNSGQIPPPSATVKCWSRKWFPFKFTKAGFKGVFCTASLQG